MYRIYLIDFDGRWIELDVEDLDFGLELTIADLQNLAVRTGSRTKEITFKGTDKNNNAFGWIYRLGRDSDLSLPNKLFFNYNSFRPVDCLIYKDTALVFRGSLRLLEVLRQRGVIYYSCVVTDAVIDLMKYIQERTLSDLDLIDLQHNYEISSVIDSWDTRTQRYSTASSTYYYESFATGSGYVYPYIDYGSTASVDNLVDLYSFRPALYVKEVMTRIFDQPALEGYTWEFKASPEITEQFNSLIVPNNQEKMKSLPFEYGLTYSRVSQALAYFTTRSQIYAWVSGVGLFTIGTKYFLNMDDRVVDPATSTFFPFAEYDLPSNTAIRNTIVTIETDAIVKVKYTIDLAYNGASGNQAVNIGVWERDASSVDYTSGYYEVAATRIGLFNSSQGVIDGEAELLVPKREFLKGKQWVLALEIVGTARGGFVNATASFHIPATSNTIVSEITIGQQIVPYLPNQVKQYDFIKAIMLAFNLYAYSYKERPKHIIFQTYDDFYALYQPDIIKTVALDWSNKVIYNEDFKKIMNLTIPKSYVYTYKEDGDWINKDYKDSFNDVYSTLRFKDIYGIQDEKKIELIFGASPMVQSNQRYHTLIRYDDDNEIKPVASQIRLLYYNGVKKCADYGFTYDNLVGPVIIDFYGEAAEYYRLGNTFSTSLQWTLPRKTYFPFMTYMGTLPNLYSSFHINQITELTDPNLYTLDCKFILSDIDISNFDFRTPIYLSVGNTDIGNNYFKVIKISWKDDKTPASVLLQAAVYPRSTNDVPTTTTTTTTSTTTTTTTEATTTTTTSTTTTTTTQEAWCVNASMTVYYTDSTNYAWSLYRTFTYDFLQSNGYKSYEENPTPPSNKLRISYLSGSVLGAPAPYGNGWYLWENNDTYGPIYYSYNSSSSTDLGALGPWSVNGPGGGTVSYVNVSMFTLGFGACNTTTTTTSTTTTTTTNSCKYYTILNDTSGPITITWTDCCNVEFCETLEVANILNFYSRDVITGDYNISFINSEQTCPSPLARVSSNDVFIYEAFNQASWDGTSNTIYDLANTNNGTLQYYTTSNVIGLTAVSLSTLANSSIQTPVNFLSSDWTLQVFIRNNSNSNYRSLVGNRASYQNSGIAVALMFNTRIMISLNADATNVEYEFDFDTNNATLLTIISQSNNTYFEVYRNLTLVETINVPFTPVIGPFNIVFNSDAQTGWNENNTDFLAAYYYNNVLSTQQISQNYNYLNKFIDEPYKNSLSCYTTSTTTTTTTEQTTTSTTTTTTTG